MSSHNAFGPVRDVDDPRTRAITNEAARGSQRDHFTDLVIAAGLVAIRGRYAINEPLGVAVHLTRTDAQDRYQVLTCEKDSSVWTPVFHVAFPGTGEREILLHRAGEWEERIFAWAFEGAGIVIESENWQPRRLPPAPAGVRLTGPEETDPVSEEAILSRVMRPRDQEAIKTLGWSVVLSPDVSIEERAMAALLLIRAWFDRSMWVHLQKGRKYTTHPDFATYCAMMLNDRSSCANLFGDEAIVSRLIELYGTEEGLTPGNSTYDNKAFKRSWAGRHATLRPFGPEDLPQSFPHYR